MLRRAPWKCRSSITEYFVELEITTEIKQPELDPHIAETKKVMWAGGRKMGNSISPIVLVFSILCQNTLF